MSDYRDPFDADALHPTRRMRARKRDRANTDLGWIVGTVFLCIVLALVFSMSSGDHRASTVTTPPTTTGSAPPASGPATVPPAPADRGGQTGGQ